MNILVTGASKGIGYEIVKQFAVNKSNNIIAIARDIELLQNLQSHCKKECQNNIHIYSIDFLSDSFKEDLDQILAKHKAHFDIIINNAGYLINKPFTDNSIIDIQKTYQVNIFAPIIILQTIIPTLNENKLCHIVNIGSMGGFQGSVKFPGLSIYSSSKAALSNFTECLAEEYKEKNIKINCLALGSVQTEMLNKAFPNLNAQVSAIEMANYIYYFSINGSKYFNGKVIPVTITTP